MSQKQVGEVVKAMAGLTWLELQYISKQVELGIRQREKEAADKLPHGTTVSFVDEFGQKATGVVKWRNERSVNLELPDGSMSRAIPWPLVVFVKAAPPKEANGAKKAEPAPAPAKPAKKRAAKKTMAAKKEAPAAEAPEPQRTVEDLKAAAVG